MEPNIPRLKRIAWTIRKDIVDMTTAARSGHPGGSLSAADIMSCLYFHEMKHDPKNPGWEDRDRFVLSKGHASPALYGTLAAAGYLPREELKSFRRLGSRLQGHPERIALPGVEVSTGSLGQGLSVAHGMALGLRLLGKASRVYCLVGDGEVQEGQVWEAVMSAGHFKTANLCAVIDHNHLQIDGRVEAIKLDPPLPDKFAAFGWNVISIDGHDYDAILEAFGEARRCGDRPTAVVAETVKGKGVSFMEDNVDFHGKAADDEEYRKAMAELDAALSEMEAEHE